MVGGEHKCAPADAAHAAAGHHQSSHHCHLLPDTPHTSTHPTGSLVLSIRQVFAIKESAQEVNRSPLMMTISVYLTNKGRLHMEAVQFPHHYIYKHKQSQATTASDCCLRAATLVRSAHWG